ncbi:FMN-dependent alpha-hydroxy acid dehydrogenase [Pseudovirgaria hyperparasitica]|uniref:FMN-dependent alpha-hydroxy acid dehydrogenase n=1 Tax=Pseudovirgaria hyperparasitica TaxID=470096 RepID=A0A6A6WFY2_9PEZI|nr:FMN-dependent alpha-hydroxy acid dehydrogenase [Pseudovirgaria hyperparasitica]KAF2760836.1 FMN-dependent alpha-hydroxy acid dehydrogenase [Pseudovirgaria hyperparasitica]
MLFILVLATLLIHTALAVRPFDNEPDTGFEAFIPTNHSLPDLSTIQGIPDFDAAARNYMNVSAYTYYRNGAAGEWSYRNNLESFGRVRWRPRVFVDIMDVESTLPTKILGYNYSVPFFIAPAARAGYANPEGEKSLVRAAEAENVLYVTSFFSSIPMDEIIAAKTNGSNSTFHSFQQLYVDNNDTVVQQRLDRIAAAGQKAIFLTVDSAANGVRTRANRYQVGSADDSLTLFTWARYRKIANMTSLPVVPKGIQSVEDAKLAVENGAPAIYLSNHGGRQLDFSPSPFEVALEIYNEAPEIFKQIEVYADGGVRYGTDVLKMLALGVRAVGIGRPFMYANCYGVDGVRKAMQTLRNEVLNDAGNLGVPNVQNVSSSVLDLKYMATNGWYTR